MTTQAAPRAAGAGPSQPMSTIQQVVYALQVVNSHSWTEPALKRDANRWLEHFQTTIEAWTVADQLLQLPASNETSNIHYFGAQTLHMKIQFKYSELPPSARPSLKDSILAHLRRLCTGPMHVLTQLCVSLALLALQMEEWSDSVKEVITTFTPKQNEGLPDNVRLGMLTCLLEFLTVVPEEAGNKRVLVLNERRSHFYRMLDSHTPGVVELLANFFQLAGSNTTMQSKVFRCLLSWLRHSSILHTTVGAQATSASLSTMIGGPPMPNVRDIFLHMISFAFEALSSPDLFETAVDVICESIRQSSIEIDRTPSPSNPQQPANLLLPNIAQLLLNHVLQLRGRKVKEILDNKSVSRGQELTGDEDDLDIVKGYCRIFAEFGESYVEVIAQGTQEGFAIVDTLLHFTDYPEPEVVSVTIWFWYRLSKILVEQPHLLSENFVRLFQNLVFVLQRQVKFPPDFDTSSRADQEEFRSWRKELADVLKDAAAVLGGDNCLAVIFGLLENLKKASIPSGPNAPPTTPSWQSFESCLYSVRAISQFVSKQSALLAKVMDALSDIPNNRHIRYTTILVLGNYAEWISLHPNYIRTAFDIVFSGFQVPALYAASALALKSLCKACREHLTGHLDALINIYEAAGNMQLPLEERGELAASVAFAVSPLPLAAVSETIRRLVLPSIVKIEQHLVAIAQDPTELGSRSKPISLELFMMFSLFKNLELRAGVAPDGSTLPFPPDYIHPAIELVDKGLPVWGKLFQLCKSDDPIMDNLCLLFKYAARSNREQFFKYLPTVIGAINSSFTEFPHSCFVYLACVFVGEYASVGESYPILASMLQAFSASTFKLFSTPSNFLSFSDVVEEYFEFVIKYVRHCPLAIAQQAPEFWQQLFNCALVGLTTLHSKKSIESIIAFFEQLLKRVLDTKPAIGLPELQVAVRNTLDQHGIPLLKGLLIGFAEHLPNCAAYWVAPVFKLLLENWNEQLQHWMISTMNDIQDSVLSKPEKELLLRSFFSSRSKQDIIDFLDHFVQLYQAKPNY